VYVIGAQCTGKTTLVNALEAEYGRKCLETGEPVPQPSVIREVARTVLKEKSFSRDDITDSPARALQLQKHILDAQLEAEETASRETGAQWYICDRSGLDPIVYARVFVGEAAAQDMLAAEAWKQLKTRMKTGVVVLCEAGCSWLVDDGTRLMPKGTEDWMRIDRAFRDLLAGAGISYVVVPKALVSLAERVALVV
ncbi:AAA domain-containing protein, partial [Massariosphaeria phaeospora]